MAFPLEMLRTTKNLFKQAYDDYSGRTARDLGIDSPEAIDKIKKIGANRIAGMMVAGTAADAVADITMNLYDITMEQAEAIAELSPRWERTAPKIFTSPINLDSNNHVGVNYYNLGTIDPYQYVKSIFKHLDLSSNNLTGDIDSSVYSNLLFFNELDVVNYNTDSNLFYPS